MICCSRQLICVTRLWPWKKIHYVVVGSTIGTFQKKSFASCVRSSFLACKTCLLTVNFARFNDHPEPRHVDCHRYSLFLGDGKVHQGHLSKQCMIWGKSMHFCSTSLHIKVQGCKTHTSTFCHRSLFLGDGKVHEGHVGKQRLIWGKWMHFCSTSVDQCSRLQNPHFNLLHHIQLVHLLSLPAVSANLHLFFPMHVSRQKAGFGGGASIYIYICVYLKETYRFVQKQITSKHKYVCLLIHFSES